MGFANPVGPYFRPLALLAAATVVVDGEVDIGASSSTHGVVVFFRPCYVRRFGFMCTSELAGGTSAAPTVVFKKQLIPLSAVGISTLATLTIPDATAIGILVQKDITPVRMVAGQAIEISWTIGTGTPTGIGMWYIECVDSPETAANMPKVLTSA